VGRGNGDLAKNIVTVRPINYHAPLRKFQEPRTKFQQSFFGDWFLEFGSWNLLLGVDHVLSAAKKESQTQSVLALSQVPQASSHPPEALPDLPSSA